MDETRLDLLALTLVPGLGVSRVHQLLKRCRDPSQIVKWSRTELKRFGLGAEAQIHIVTGCARRDAEEALRKAQQQDIKLITWFDDGYPFLLRQICDPPLILYLRGELDCLYRPSVAVVGSRRCTVYGREVAFRLSADLASLGITIVSGMARGIDTRAHQGAVEAGGATVAVLGSGVDVVYPRENGKLYRSIVRQGCVLSEFPLGTYPAPQNFPVRNRIISGLSRGTLIPEAAQFSGSLITARLTLEQNRELWAVPGNITSPASYGPNQLIKQGAKPIVSAQDILEELPPYLLKELLPESEEKRLASGVSTTVSAKEESLLNLLGADRAVHFDILLQQGEMSLSELSSLLLNLEMKGLIEHLPGRRYSRKWAGG
ncbi:MAG TPA: DNA-processing protein DprA [Acidobacteriota bacterium]|nr:DNA-processing protein DprA [Acidobacteriota bacterium]